MVDFHSHILPNIDDGSSSIEESVALLNILHEQGVNKIVFTPHFYIEQNTVEQFLENRQNAYNRLKDFIPQDMEVKLGAEVALSKSFTDFSKLDKLKIGDTSFVLIELPHVTRYSRNFEYKLNKIIDNTSLVPILAHVDNYVYFRNKPERIAKFIKNGCLIQVNANAFLKKYKRSFAKALLKHGQIHCLGSDTHNLDKRPPTYGNAMEVIKNTISNKKLAEFLRIGPGIYNNEDVDILNPKPIHKILGMYL